MFAQNDPILVEIEHLGVKEGLLGRHVHHLHQDKNGIIWAITSDGLNRYDGRDFKWYKEFASVDYFASNKKIMEDAEGFLWIIEEISNNPLPIQYLVNSNTYEVVLLEDKIKTLPFKWDEIIDTQQGKDGILYFLSKNNKIFVLKSNGQFTQRNIDNETKYLQFIEEDANQNLWFFSLKDASITSLIKIDVSGTTTKINFPKNYLNQSISYRGKSKEGFDLLFQERINEYLFITIKNDKPVIEIINKQDQISDSILVKFSNDQPLEILGGLNYLSSLNNLKIVSSEGEILYDFFKEHPILDVLNRKDFKMKILTNYKNLVWLSTSQGIYKIHIKKSLFNPFLKANKNPSDIFYCRKIHRDSKGDLMVNHISRGIWVNKQPIHLEIEDNQRPIFTDFTEGKDNNYWFSHGTKLLKRTTDGSITTIDLSKKGGIPNFGLFYIHSLASGDIFLGGTSLQGLYSPSKDTLIQFKMEFTDQRLLDQRILDIYHVQKDQEGNVWCGTSLGLMHVDLDKMTMSSFWNDSGKTIQLVDSDVHHFYQDEEGIYWLAGKNLTRWNPKTNEIKVYTPTNGLPSQILHAVYPDDYGNLWMSSENGILRFNKKTEKVQNYFTSDGITHNEFNRLSHFKDSDGTIYFGGINGLTSFHPKDFQQNESSQLKNTAIVLTEFEQFSGKEDKIINNLSSLLSKNEIVLLPRDRFFRVQFTVSDYIQNKDIQYEYKINGHEENWTTIRENYISVSGLPYGNYTLNIKAKLTTGKHLPKELNIPIKVLRPFYMKTWFFVLFGLITIMTIFLFIKIRLRRLELQKAELQRMVALRTQIIESQRKKLEASNIFKNRLFTIIAHDMRNAVYSFNGVTKTIKTFIKFNQPERISTIYNALENSSSNLQHLLDNLLDWALSQRGEISYEPEILSIEALFDDCIHSFDEISKQEAVFIKKENLQNLKIYADKKSMEIILRNLIGNAMKYTPSSGEISLSTTQKGQYNILKIKDTGSGIDQESLSKLFVPNRNKVKAGLNGQKGSGIGLLLVKELVELNKGTIKVESILNKGTSFELSFPNANANSDMITKQTHLIAS